MRSVSRYPDECSVLANATYDIQSLPVRRTLKAKPFRPTVKPGRGSYRVPALETRAKVVVGPGISLLANFTPAAVPVSYWKDPEAGAARPLRLAGCWHCLRRARCACRPIAERDSIVKEPRAGMEDGVMEQLADGRCFLKLLVKLGCLDDRVSSAASLIGRPDSSILLTFPHPPCATPNTATCLCKLHPCLAVVGSISLILDDVRGL